MYCLRSLSLLKKLMISRLYFGHYHYPDYSNFVNNIFRSFCIVYTVGIFFIYLYIYPGPLDFVKNHTYTYTIIEAILDNLISLCLRGIYLKKLYALISKLQKMLRLRKIGISRDIYLSLFICSSLRVYIVFNYSPFLISDVRTWIAGFAFVSLCVNYVSKIIVFDIIYHFMRVIRIQFEFKHMHVNIIGQKRVRHRIESIKTCLSVYNELVYFMKNMDVEVQAWMFLTLFISFPKTVAFTHRSVTRLLRMTAYEAGPFIPIAVSIYTVIIACIPAILVELAVNEVDIIKKVLARNLILSKDEALLQETQRALDYINLLPFKYSIWRIIPVNATLPLKFISLCVTYIIVVAQFSNFTIQ